MGESLQKLTDTIFDITGYDSVCSSSSEGNQTDEIAWYNYLEERVPKDYKPFVQNARYLHSERDIILDLEKGSTLKDLNPENYLRYLIAYGREIGDIGKIPHFQLQQFIDFVKLDRDGNL